MVLEYRIKGITLTEEDLTAINEYYETACTAEYLLDKYSDRVKNEEQAMKIAREVRSVMADWHMTEDEAIEEVL